MRRSGVETRETYSDLNSCERGERREEREERGRGERYRGERKMREI